MRVATITGFSDLAAAGPSVGVCVRAVAAPVRSASARKPRNPLALLNFMLYLSQTKRSTAALPALSRLALSSLQRTPLQKPPGPVIRARFSHEKYSRQILFDGIGLAGQERLLASSAVVVGCGAIGAATANLLVRAGVGRIRIVDRDFVEPSNLQRQTLFDESDAAQALPKAIAAERKLNHKFHCHRRRPRRGDMNSVNITESAQLISISSSTAPTISKLVCYLTISPYKQTSRGFTPRPSPVTVSRWQFCPALLLAWLVSSKGLTRRLESKKLATPSAC